MWCGSTESSLSSLSAGHPQHLQHRQIVGPAAVQGELDRVSQTLTGRVRELAERYATPLPELIGEVDTLAARVDGHLKRMGAVWK